jgi:hypothetical protein
MGRGGYEIVVAPELRLDSGELISLDDDEATRLYEALWSQATHQRGAVPAAAKVRRARASGRAESLDPHESSAVRDALGSLVRRPG